MEFQLDHDYHIHSYLSSCSKDPLQTPAHILRHAQENGFEKICLTDHFWDERVAGVSNWYRPQDFAHVTASLPLPQGEKTQFYFGCETDLDKYMRLGVSRERMECFDFIIVSTTHLNMLDFTIERWEDNLPRRRELYLARLEALLNKDLPFHKIGIAHLTCSLLAPNKFEDHIEVIDAIPDDTFSRLFEKAAKRGVGIELNLAYDRYTPEQREIIMRPFVLAKRAGCKFYMGSDAHTPRGLETCKARFASIAAYLELTEEDKFRPFG